MRELLGMEWKSIAIVLDKTSEACRKQYSNQKLIAGLPPIVVLPKNRIINATIGVKLKKKMKENPKISYRKLAGWLKGRKVWTLAIARFNAISPKMSG